MVSNLLEKLLRALRTGYLYLKEKNNAKLSILGFADLTAVDIFSGLLSCIVKRHFRRT